MTPARFRWGILLVLIGTVLLLANLDVLNYNFWADFATFFPVLLIAIGVEKIFLRSRAQFISYLTSVGILVGGLYLAFAGSSGGEQSSFFSQTSYKVDPSPDVRELHAVLDLGDADLTIRDATDNLIEGQFHQFTSKPQIDYKLKDSVGTVTFSGTARRFLRGIIRVDGDEPSDWYLAFSRLIPLSLDCHGRNNDIHLNLEGTPTRSVNVQSDEGAVYVKIGSDEPLVTVSLTGRDAEVRLRVPSTSGLKVSGVNDRDYLERVGLEEVNGAFVSHGYDTVGHRIQVNLDDRLSSLSIDFY